MATIGKVRPDIGMIDGNTLPTDATKAQQPRRQALSQDTGDARTGGGAAAGTAGNPGAEYAAAQAALYQQVADAWRNAYNSSVGRLHNTADAGLQQAYLADRLGRRNLGQQLSALGRHGGMSETTLLGLANNYTNNRAAMERTRVEGLSALEQQLNTGLGSANMAYLNALLGKSGSRQDIAGIQNNFASQIAAAQKAIDSQQAQALAQQAQMLSEASNAPDNGALGVVALPRRTRRHDDSMGVY